jgi:hypothetical protein
VANKENPQKLTAGPWSAVLAPDGSLTRVSWRGVEVLRGLSVVVRTNTWLTVSPEATLSRTTSESGFAVEITARNRGPQVDFSWSGKIVCEATGDFHFSMDGTSAGVTATNRIGLVALHSLNWAGQECELTHTDGSAESTAYPELVSPHQPMKDIRAISQTIAPGHTLRIAFEGEIFEMEDQRNWTDASYKTYSRPLEWPFPYEIADGERVTQAITMSVSHAQVPAEPAASPPTTSPSDDSGPIVVSLEGDSSIFTWPQLGLGTDPTTPGLLSSEIVHELRPSHLRVDVVTEAGALRGKEVLAEACTLGVPLELAIHVGDDHHEGLRELEALLQEVKISAVLVFDTSSPSTTKRASGAVAKELLPQLPPGVPVFVGTDDNFTELNRNRLSPSDLGAYGVCFSPNPQIHDSSERAILETAEAFPAIIQTIRSFSDGAPQSVSPLTFKARRNIHAPGRVIDRVGRDEDSADERWGGMFSAVWLVATLVPILEGGVERITLGEIAGARGLISATDIASGNRSELTELWSWLSEPRSSVKSLRTGHSELIVLADSSGPETTLLVTNCGDSPRELVLQGSTSEQTLNIPARSVQKVKING